jgi:hypothetical protein
MVMVAAVEPTTCLDASVAMGLQLKGCQDTRAAAAVGERAGVQAGRRALVVISMAPQPTSASEGAAAATTERQPPQRAFAEKGQARDSVATDEATRILFEFVLASKVGTRTGRVTALGRD